jgi:YidC/Oxa1 family membrane protein insertase
MDKNFFLAVILSVGIFVGWSVFMQKRYPQATRPKPSQTQTAQSQATASTRAKPAPPSQATLGPSQPAAPSEQGGLDGALSFHVDQLEFKVQPFGGSIVSYLYPGPLGAVELVQRPYPGFFATWPELKFNRVGNDKNWPVFEAKHPSGLVLRKEYLFREQGQMHTLRLTLHNPTKRNIEMPAWAIDLGPGMGTVPSELKENTANWMAVALLPHEKKGKRDRFEEYKVKEEPVTVTAPWRWLAVQNRYFLAAIFPPQEHFASFSVGARKKRVQTTGWLGQKKMADELAPWLRAEAAPAQVAGGSAVEIQIPFYFGPKGFTHLSAMGQGLERAVSFGWFNRLGRLTMQVLQFFYGWTQNWGWAIILLTLVLQLVMFPLTYKSTKSMTLMKKIQPEQARLQQKFKSNPQRMNQELMELYKKRGVNPLSGCLPMLAQMPIFIALFNMLRNAWELHGAVWIFWVQDLSAADPFYVLPLVMGAVMFFQNKLQPTVGDPNQAKMMQYMPIIFTFMFLRFPAGLVLYWLTNSILSFGQQILIRRRMGV